MAEACVGEGVEVPFVGATEADTCVVATQWLGRLPNDPRNDWSQRSTEFRVVLRLREQDGKTQTHDQTIDSASNYRFSLQTFVDTRRTSSSEDENSSEDEKPTPIRLGPYSERSLARTDRMTVFYVTDYWVVTPIGFPSHQSGPTPARAFSVESRRRFQSAATAGSPVVAYAQQVGRLVADALEK